jgi:hypothetical protein
MEAVECGVLHEPLEDMKLYLSLGVTNSGEEEESDEGEEDVPLWS